MGGRRRGGPHDQNQGRKRPQVMEERAVWRFERLDGGDAAGSVEVPVTIVVGTGGGDGGETAGVGRGEEVGRLVGVGEADGERDLAGDDGGLGRGADRGKGGGGTRVSGGGRATAREAAVMGFGLGDGVSEGKKRGFGRRAAADPSRRRLGGRWIGPAVEVRWGLDQAVGETVAVQTRQRGMGRWWLCPVSKMPDGASA